MATRTVLEKRGATWHAVCVIGLIVSNVPRKLVQKGLVYLATNRAGRLEFEPAEAEHEHVIPDGNTEFPNEWRGFAQSGLTSVLWGVTDSDGNESTITATRTVKGDWTVVYTGPEKGHESLKYLQVIHAVPAGPLTATSLRRRKSLLGFLSYNADKNGDPNVSHRLWQLHNVIEELPIPAPPTPTPKKAAAPTDTEQVEAVTA